MPGMCFQSVQTNFSTFFEVKFVHSLKADTLKCHKYCH